MTGVRSRWVVAVAGVILLALGLLPKLATIVASIPVAVLGGAGIAMFGMVAATGIKILGKVNFENRNNLLIVAISLGVSMIPLVAPNFFDQFPHWTAPLTHSGITLGALCAVLLNAVLNAQSSGTGKDDRGRGAGALVRDALKNSVVRRPGFNVRSRCTLYQGDEALDRRPCRHVGLTRPDIQRFIFRSGELCRDLCRL